jgi:hypothetical protein
MTIDFQTPPWWKDGPNDYTKNRSAGVDYTVDDLIGRKDVQKYTLTTDDVATVSGTDGTILI